MTGQDSIPGFAGHSPLPWQLEGGAIYDDVKGPGLIVELQIPERPRLECLANAALAHAAVNAFPDYGAMARALDDALKVLHLRHLPAAATTGTTVPTWDMCEKQPCKRCAPLIARVPKEVLDG